MAARFRTLCSSSKGNCLCVETGRGKVLIDCGFGSQKAFRRAIGTAAGGEHGILAVVVSHNHTDHINYSALRVIEEYGLTLKVHERNVRQLRKKHFKGYAFKDLRVESFSDEGFEIGGMRFEVFELTHMPGYATFGFLVRRGKAGRTRTIVIASDFYEGDIPAEELAAADLVYIESNHDPELLEMYPNYNSRYHLSNPEAAELMAGGPERTAKRRQVIILGHLSEMRNDAELARASMVKALREAGRDGNCEVMVAPRYKPSETVAVGS